MCDNLVVANQSGGGSGDSDLSNYQLECYATKSMVYFLKYLTDKKWA